MIVELVYTESPAPSGTVVGAVEIVDERLVTVARTVLRAEQAVPLDLPTGSYLAQGWLPSGERLWTMFDTTDGDNTVRISQPAVTQSAETTAGWLRCWEYTGRSWSLATQPQIAGVGSSAVDVTMSSARAAALQVGSAAYPPRITVVPGHATVQLCGHPESGWRVGLTASIEATLLGYLYGGDISSAHTVARHALHNVPTPAAFDRPLLAVILGYYLLRTGDERAGDWIADLEWHLPESVDTAILSACLLRRDIRVPASTIRDEFVRAASSGLPVIAEGLHLLASGLAAAGGTDRARLALTRVRTYLAVLQDGPLTTFPGIAPDQPDARVTLLIGTPDGALAFQPEAPRDDQPGDPPERAGPIDRHNLHEALRRLQTRRIGTVPTSEKIEVDHLTLTARVTGSSRSTSMDLLLAAANSPSVSFHGIVVDLQVDSRSHCLGEFDDDGRCSIVGVPAGTWEFTTRQRNQVRRVPLPQVAEQQLAAADPHAATEILRTMLPDNQGLVVLRRSRDGRYRLELMVPAAMIPTIFVVEYEQAAGGIASRIVPTLATRAGRSNSVVRLDGFVAMREWAITPVTPSDIALSAGSDVVTSVRAAASHETRAAWRALADDLADALATVVRAELGPPDGQERR